MVEVHPSQIGISSLHFRRWGCSAYHRQRSNLTPKDSSIRPQPDFPEKGHVSLSPPQSVSQLTVRKINSKLFSQYLPLTSLGPGAMQGARGSKMKHCSYYRQGFQVRTVWWLFTRWCQGKINQITFILWTCTTFLCQTQSVTRKV